MKTSRILWLAGIAFVLLIVVNSSCSSYSKMVDLQEGKNKTWGNVQGQYQRRADLIPNLEDVVKNYASFEKSTMVEVTQARRVTNEIKIDANNITPEALAKFDAAQSNLSSALSRLMVVMEKYPDLKANEQFLSLQAELAGTENRIAVSRKDFNDAVEQYNKYIRKPGPNILASAFGFNSAAYFESKPGADTAPRLNMKIN